MKKLVLASLLAAMPALADDPRRAMFADSAAVASLRPRALAGALRRLGTGWDRLVRERVPLPAAVSPLDPAVLALTGVDPAGVVWASARALRGGLNVRVALPLVEAGVADALVHTMGLALHVSIERGVAGVWTTRLPDGTPLVARLDGSTLVLDGVLANATMRPTTADVLRVVPLRPPRAFSGTRGMQKRMTANDAFAVWADLDAVAKLGEQRGEAQMSQALKSVAPAQRAAISREGQAELARCKASMNALPRSFDDVLLSFSTSDDRLRVELAEGGRKAALDGLRLARTAPTHTLPDCADADLCLQSIAPPIPKLGAHHAFQPGCSVPASLAELAWGWPSLAGTDDRSPWFTVLRGLHALAVAIPGADASVALFSPQRFVATAELDGGVRADVDRLLSSLHFDATAPVDIGRRSLTTWTAPSIGGEAPVVALDSGTSVVVGALGLRALVRTALDATVAEPVASKSTVLTLTLSARGLQRLGRQVDAEDLSLVDGVARVEGAVTLDDDAIRLDAELALKPR